MKKTIILGVSLLSITMPCLAPLSPSEAAIRISAFHRPQAPAGQSFNHYPRDKSDSAFYRPEAPEGQSFNHYPRNNSDTENFVIATAAIVAGVAALGLGTWFMHKKMSEKPSEKTTGGAKKHATPKAS